jgi:UrcA family protein
VPKLLLALIAACALVPAAASAEPVRTVSTAGVDFRDPAAVEALYGQLHASAAAVCDSYAETSRVSQADVACAEETLARAVKTIDRPQLYASYERRHAGARAAGPDTRRAQAADGSARN